MLRDWIMEKEIDYIARVFPSVCRLHGKRGLELLERKLFGPNPGRAAKILSNMGDAGIRILVDKLDRGYIFEAIRDALNRREALPYLINALENDNRDIRINAARVIRTISYRTRIREASGPLQELAGSHDEEMGGIAFEALAHVADPRTVPVLISRLDDEKMISHAVEGLVKIGKRAIPEVSGLLDSEETPEVKGRALWILRKIIEKGKHDDVVEKMVDFFVRNEVPEDIECISDLKERAVPHLIERMGDPLTRGRALYGLCSIEGPPAVDRLMENLKDPNPRTRYWIIRGFDLVLKDQHREVRVTDMAPHLTEMLDDQFPGIRTMALRTIAEMIKKRGSFGFDEDKLVAKISERLDDENMQVRCSATYAMLLAGVSAPKKVDLGKMRHRLREYIDEEKVQGEDLRKITAMYLSLAREVRYKLPDLDMPKLKKPVKEAFRMAGRRCVNL